MKWNRTVSGNYNSEDGKYQIRKHGSLFELYSLTEQGLNGGVKKSVGNKYLGGFYTLREAKAAAK